jgi:hypothetical protein
MSLRRRKQTMHWEVNGQPLGKAELTAADLPLTERLVLANYGKGTGAIFKNLVVRSRIKGVDPSWPHVDESVPDTP